MTMNTAGKTALITILLFMFPLNITSQSNTPAADESILTSEGFDLAAQNSLLEIYADDENSAFAVRRKDNGALWFSGIPATSTELANWGSQWEYRVWSMFELQYGRKDAENMYIIHEKHEDVRSVLEIVDNGLKYSFFIDHLGISFDMIVSLADDSIDVTIPFDSVRESGDQQIIDIRVLPYFGATVDSDEGFVFYPDGSGAIHYIKKDHPEYLQEFEEVVYGQSPLDLSSRQDSTKLFLPVFGVSRNGAAFTAYITEGSENAYIGFTPSGYRINSNRVSAGFIYRTRFSVRRSNVVSRTTQALSTTVQLVDPALLGGDRTLRYSFLSEGQSGYSDMANRYRKELQDRSELGKAGTPFTIALDFLLGITEERILIDRHIEMTHMENVQEYLEELMNWGITSLNVNLLGWEKSGYLNSPKTIPVNRSIGGLSGLEELLDYTVLHDIPLSINLDLSRAYESSGGFSVYRDVIKNPLGLVITNEASSRYYISPEESRERLNSIVLPYFEEVNGLGITLEMAGELLFLDRRSEGLFTREDSLRTWVGMLEDIADNGSTPRVSGGNKYILPYAVWLADIPFEDSGHLYTDEAVPFFQMVVHGILPYTAVPGNLSWDHEWMVLKWIEYGYMPYYQLSRERAGELKDTNYTRLFNPAYEDWKDRILEVYQRISDSGLAETYSKEMIFHQRLSEDIARTGFSDGSAVYVNYGDEQWISGDGVTVPPGDFAYISGEGEK